MITAERLVKYEKAVPAVYVPECNKTKLNMSDKAKVDGRFIKETAFGVHGKYIVCVLYIMAYKKYNYYFH